MRAFLIGAALVVAAQPGVAQPVATKRPNEVRAQGPGKLEPRLLSSDELRALSEEFKTMSERMKLVLDSVRASGADVSQFMSQVFTRQSRLAMECARLRMLQSPAEGYLGFDVRGDAERVRTTNNTLIDQYMAPPVVVGVIDGSPAAQADVRAGDEWVAINGRMLVGFPLNDLAAIVKPGVRVEVRVHRDNRDVDLTLTPVKRPEYPKDACAIRDLQVFTFTMPASVAGATSPDGPKQGVLIRPSPGLPVITESFKVNFAGAVLRVLSKDMRDQLQVRSDGVLVDAIIPRSAAEAAGLRIFDVIISVNGGTVSSPLDLANASSGPDPTLTLKVFSKGETRTVKLTVPR